MTAITFYPPLTPPFTATITEIEQDTSAAKVTVRATIPFALWERIQREALFHAWFAPDHLPDFGNDQPIYLTLRLSPAYSATLPSPLNSEALGTLGERQPELFSTMAWLLLAATQQVPLPATLQSAESALYLGAATQWNTLFTPPMPVVAAPEAVILAFFEAEEWLYEELKPSLWRVAVQGESGAWTMMVQLDTENELCSVYSVLPEVVEEETHRNEVGAYLSGLNYDLVVGNWEMDGSDGEIRFRTSLDYEGATLADALFARLMIMNMDATEAYFEEIMARVRG